MIYNPWSVMNCLNYLYNGAADNPYRNYWAVSGSVKLIEDAFKSLSPIYKVDALMAKGCVQFKFRENLRIENIKEDENAFLSFLVYSGYLTKVKDQQSESLSSGALYQIPNKEVAKLFYDEFLSMWIRGHKRLINFDEMENVNIESCNEYSEDFQRIVLDKLGNKQVNETSFQNYLAHCFRYLASYSYDIEVKTFQNKRMDLILKPIKGRSEKVFIFELKKTKIPEEAGKMTDYAFYQIFEKGYCEDLLKKAAEKNDHWKKFVLRAVVFSLDKSMEKWILSMEEFEFDKIELESIIKAFNKLQPKNDKMRDFIKKFKADLIINLV
ncbi:hypothetical protein SteCoe_12051 [Stentor coeruleus]|uniref:AAA-ATPase-like domain-containing protein n=1 Tax=Stentor coeruleus TaxID=5963 RepID=A0A1R2CBT8_9CILI|nr:hypothetical protein SteCoe_12051 [Stentor coeruleus]